MLGLAGWLAVAFAAAGIGAIASSRAGAFYQGLVRPDWAPPAWLFAPVWSALYALWRWLFFAWRQGALAFAEIVVLWILIVATVVAFWRVQALAGALLLPYLVWVTYAAALSFSVWRLNPGALG